MLRLRRYTLTVVIVAWLLVGIAIGAALVGCAPQAEIPLSPGVNVGKGVSRYIDAEAGVVCWVYVGYEAGGISCLPLADTRLDH